MNKTINGMVYSKEFLVERLADLQYLMKTHIELWNIVGDDESTLYYKGQITETQNLLNQFE